MTKRIPQAKTEAKRADNNRKNKVLFSTLMVVSGFILAALFILPAWASLSDSQRSVLDNVSNAMNQYRTLSGEFIQTGPNGGTAKGIFHLQRPGRIRFQYSDPSTLDLIADGKSVAVINRELKTQDLLPIRQTPLRYLLERRLNLNNVAGVKNVGLLGDDIVVIIEDKEAFNESQLRLFFDKTSYDLKQWIVTDAQGLDTSVEIFNTKKNSKVKRAWFQIKYPGE